MILLFYEKIIILVKNTWTVISPALIQVFYGHVARLAMILFGDEAGLLRFLYPIR